MILYLTSDLLFASRVQSAAAAAGLSALTLPSIDSLLTAVEAHPQAGVLLDLEHPGLAVGELLPRLPGRTGRWIAAYGPHVHEARLQAARAAGCDEVLTRGGLHQHLADVLRRLAAGRADA